MAEFTSGIKKKLHKSIAHTSCVGRVERQSEVVFEINIDLLQREK